MACFRLLHVMRCNDKLISDEDIGIIDNKRTVHVTAT